MTTNILIGIGGTGAKVVEAAMMLVTAGLGPDTLEVGLVDQDDTNGNVARTEKLIEDYIAARAAWDTDSTGNNKLAWVDADPEDSIALCRTRVNRLWRTTVKWCPGEDDSTLRAMIGRDLGGDHLDLFDMLFTPGKDEQELPLGKGYQGRAHVGAAAIIARLAEPGNRFDARLRELMAGGADSEAVRIFLAGSAFGGTGAAGFPTLARHLNAIRNEKDFANREKIVIGGILMLPYFGFASRGKESQAVSTEELMPKTQVALQHYHGLLDVETVFDDLYLLGAEQAYDLGYHEAGAELQENPALLPDLLAGSAATRFFADSASRVVKGGKTRLYISGASDVAPRWADLMLPTAGAAYANLLRFAIYWSNVAHDMIGSSKLLGMFGGNWSHQLRGKAKLEKANPAIEKLETLLRSVTTFAGAIEAKSPGRWGKGPWTIDALRDPAADPTPQHPFPLAERSDIGHEFGKLIRQPDGEPCHDDAGVINDELTEAADRLARGGHQGFGKVVAAAYRATRVR